MHPATLLFLVAGTAQAYELDFYVGGACTSENLEISSHVGPTDCININTGPSSQAQSFIIASNDPTDLYNEVNVYTGPDCTGDVTAVGSAGTVCYPNQEDEAQSYQIVPAAISKRKERETRGRNARRASKRSPATIGGEFKKLAESHKALVRRGELETDVDLAPPKKYDVGSDVGSFNGIHTDVAGIHPYIAATASFLVTGLSFTSLVTGCIGVGGAGAVSSASCATSLAATGISFLLTAYSGYQAIQNIRATLRNNNVSIGLRRIGARGTQQTDMVMTHEEYMEYILSLSGINGTHLGYTQRYRDDDRSTPVYSFSGANGQEFAYTISADENDEVRHSISFAHDTAIVKRQGYQGVTVNGGLDLDGCQRSAGSYAEVPTDPATVYDYFYDDIACLIGGDEIVNSNYIQGDVMDRNGGAILTWGMTAWKSTSDADYVLNEPICSNEMFYFEQTCQY